MEASQRFDLGRGWGRLVRVDGKSYNAGDRRNGILVMMTGMQSIGPHMLVRFILTCFMNGSNCIEGPPLTRVIYVSNQPR